MAILLPLSVLAAAPPAPSDSLHREGRAAFQRGDLEGAVSRWSEAEQAARARGDRPGRLVALGDLAEAYLALGRYREALATLDEALPLARAAGDPAGLASILGRLGGARVAAGALGEARIALDEALGLARVLGDPRLESVILQNLGNALALEHRPAEAREAYDASAAAAGRAGAPVLAARALANAGSVARGQGQPGEARTLFDRAAARLVGPPPSHGATYALIAIALGYRELRAPLPEQADRLLLDAATLLQRAGTAADAMGDRRAASYAWGHLGAVYEDGGRPAEALGLTHRAIAAAQRVHAPESLYRWQWQAGRLLRAGGRTTEALAAYRRAVRTLQTIRGELAASYGAPRGSFGETVARLHLELVDLLLREAAHAPDDGRARPLLLEARDVVEQLKVAELRDYFRDDCVELARARATALDVVSPTAAVVYPILLPDRLELLVSLPDGLRRRTVPVGAETVAREVRRLRNMLEKRTTREFLPHAQAIYDWLVRPIEAELARHPIDTLVFVPDGPLRTIPMAALHDGRDFLVRRYALAITPGLTLTDPRPLRREGTRVLAAGVTGPVQGFPPLPSVAAEIETLRQLFGTTVLLDEDFRLAALEEKLREEPFTIVHIASHGEFTRDAAKAFLLAFDARLTVDRLDQAIGLFRYRDDPLELLTLSACDTAAGDDRAALGLAGVAVKAGARAALATLWQVNDEVAAELIGDFYRGLRDPRVSRGAALRGAQLRLLDDPRYDHPGFWSPFVLINNWL